MTSLRPFISQGNTGSNSTREAIHATEYGFGVGMHGALHINPYYGKTSNEWLIRHFKSVLGMGPTIIYNVPGRTCQDITPPVIEKISEHPNFVGVKECTGNERIGAYVDRGLCIWSRNDDQFHDARSQVGSWCKGRYISGEQLDTIADTQITL